MPRKALVYEQIKSFLQFPSIPSFPLFITVQPRPATALQLRSGRSRVGPGQVRSARQCQYNSHQLYTSACCIARPLARWAGYVASAPQESDLMQQAGRTGEAKGRVRGRRFEQDYYGGNLIPLTSSARTLLVVLLCPSCKCLVGDETAGPRACVFFHCLRRAFDVAQRRVLARAFSSKSRIPNSPSSAVNTYMCVACAEDW